MACLKVGHLLIYPHEFQVCLSTLHLNTEPSLVVEGYNKCMPLFNCWKLFEVWEQVNLPIKNRYNCFAVLCTNKLRDIDVG